jgi:hypothetical protein
MPRSSQIPELPQPVPISTTARAPIAVARKRSAAPVSGATGAVPPRSAAFARAVSSGSSSIAKPKPPSVKSLSMAGPLPHHCAPIQVRALAVAAVSLVNREPSQ